MGTTPPPPPRLPPAPPIPLDFARGDHRELWSRYEAKREYEAYQNANDYTPAPVRNLWVFGGKVIHVILPMG